MEYNAENDQESIRIIFNPEKITEFAFNQLEKKSIWRNIIKAHHMSKKSEFIKNRLTKIKGLIVLYSRTSEVEYHKIKRSRMNPSDEQSSEILSEIISENFKLHCDLISHEKDEERTRRLRNRVLAFKIGIIVSLSYLAILSISTKSLDHRPWLEKFKEHLEFLLYLFTLGLLLCSFVLGFFVYQFLNKKFIENMDGSFFKRGSVFPNFFCGVLAFFVAVFFYVIFMNGLSHTLNIDVWQLSQSE